MITFGSLFAGIGGFDLGLERAGMICKWQVEIDSFCQKVLAKHWPNVGRYGDVRECGKHNLETVDLICGGFPCQPHSLAGKRRGAEDDRNLWPEYLRVVAEMRPRWVIGENVPGIRTTMLDAVLSDLENLSYSVETIIVPACAFDAPHRRERVFILAHANGGGVEIGRTHKGASTTCRTGKNDASGSGGNGGWVSTTQQNEDVAHANREGLSESVFGKLRGVYEEKVSFARGQPCRGNAKTRRKRETESILGSVVDGVSYGLARCRWLPEPGISRVATGIPNRTEKIRALGNAVVPQVAEWIGCRIVDIDSCV